jgi:DNA polymerase
MRWPERQRAMLRAMGIVLPPEPAAAVDAPAVAGVTSAALAVTPMREPAPRPAATATRAAASLAPVLDAAHVARAERIAALGWDALRAEAQACQACALHAQRKQAVFGVGDPAAAWMIVGEAPGEQEDRQGEPFVGPAGQLLDRMLHAIGLTRGEAPPERRVYIANTLKCRPPRNRNPEPEESAACAPLLARQIELVRPRILLAMGRFAAQRLLGTDEAIGRLRGQVHPWRLADGSTLPLIVTYHPAYLLRNPADKARSWADLCLARLTQGGTAAPS